MSRAARRCRIPPRWVVLLGPTQPMLILFGLFELAGDLDVDRISDRSNVSMKRDSAKCRRCAEWSTMSSAGFRPT